MRSRRLFAVLTASSLLGTLLPATAQGQAGLRVQALFPTDDVTIDAVDPDGRRSDFVYLYVEGDAFRTTKRILVRFNLAPLFNEAVEITRADLHLWRVEGLGHSVPESDPNLRVWRVGTWWEEENAEWNSRPRVVGRPSAWQGVRVPREGRYITWDVTHIVREWFEGEPNYGFSVAARPDRADQFPTEFTVVFESRESAPPGAVYGQREDYAGHAPRLRVQYRPKLTLQSIPATLASPTPTPSSTFVPLLVFPELLASPTPTPKGTKQTKGAFITRPAQRPAPWWMSRFLRRLLGVNTHLQ